MRSTSISGGRNDPLSLSRRIRAFCCGRVRMPDRRHDQAPSPVRPQDLSSVRWHQLDHRVDTVFHPLVRCRSSKPKVSFSKATTWQKLTVSLCSSRVTMAWCEVWPKEPGD